MKLFGGLLPFIGFQEEDIPPDLAAALGMPKGTTRVNTFQSGWLNHSICIPLDQRNKETR